MVIFMTCFHPLRAYKTASGSIVFNGSKPNITEFLDLPCGKCIGCRLDRSRQWAIRCMHEASLFDRNCFITLTYDDAHLPEDRSVNVRHFQLFMKKLRKRFGSNIRFYHCGEYGDKTSRPHYHAILFNFDFDDKKLFTVRNGYPVYISQILNEIWGNGFCEIGTVTFESAAYVARYIMKKVNGKLAEGHYDFVHPVTGQIYSRSPEYTTMSRRPGIGTAWFDKFGGDVFPHDRVIIAGRELRPPKFYDKRLKDADPVMFDEVVYNRFCDAQKRFDNTSEERLNVRERCQEISFERLIRPLL